MPFTLRSPLAAAFGLLLFVAGPLQARIWTDNLNRTWEGEFLRLETGNVIFQVAGKEYPFPLAKLSSADRAWVISTINRPPPTAQASAAPAQTAPAATPTGDVTFGGTKLEAGKTTVIVMTLPPASAKVFSEIYHKPSTTIKVAVALPSGFDPTKPQRLLLTSASSSGDGLSTKNMPTYTAAALARGWVVMSADGEFGKPDEDGVLRAKLLETVMSEVMERWPAAQKTWSVATAGFSGGAGYASLQAVILAKDWRVIGMMLFNNAVTPVAWEKESYVKTSKPKMHKIPVFMSAGETDNVAKPEVIKRAIEITKVGGYRTMRTEWHPGGHSPNAAHITTALEWFESLEK